jgi:hypothetical protein
MHAWKRNAMRAEVARLLRSDRKFTSAPSTGWAGSGAVVSFDCAAVVCVGARNRSRSPGPPQPRWCAGPGSAKATVRYEEHRAVDRHVQDVVAGPNRHGVRIWLNNYDKATISCGLLSARPRRPPQRVHYKGRTPWQRGPFAEAPLRGVHPASTWPPRRPV